MRVGSYEIDVLRTRTAVIGSGCAGLNAADWLWELGERDVLLITDGMNRGTSRNAGSDKQTYYKLSLAGDSPDSVRAMAQDLAAEGVNGDTALAEAAGSAQSFFRLVQLGVPFPANEFGEYVGYQTDHDLRGRATSAGPLTSKLMTEALQAQVVRKNIPVLDRATAFRILTHEGRVAGVLVWSTAEKRLKLILAAHVILATGGPAQLYEASVFPLSQQGMSGMAISAGARMANLHQWQYGLASTKFRWNVSGSYQQVLPRILSVDENGVEREFLLDALSPADSLLIAFRKGYQWPFDTRKIDGSSRIDLLVHRENALGRRVYLDFRRNPSVLKEDFSNLADEAKQYLTATGSLQATPIERLRHMNAPAIALYADHSIDLEIEMLEIRVCAQHHNGGVAVDANWQSSVPGLYAAGEAAGTFGAYRPGGSALNATQVGSMRAAQHIAWDSKLAPIDDEHLLRDEIENALSGLNFPGNAAKLADDFRHAMSLHGAHLRDPEALRALDERAEALLTDVQGAPDDLSQLESRLRLRDQLVTLRAVVSAMLTCAETVGSDGAGLALRPDGSYLPRRAMSENNVLCTERNHSFFVPARPIPQGETVFENAWRAYRQRTGRE